jgi:uncharacterized membrane protein YvbJ
MGWPRFCSVCGSADVQAVVHEVFCLKCGRTTDMDGKPVPLEVQFNKEPF